MFFEYNVRLAACSEATGSKKLASLEDGRCAWVVVVADTQRLSIIKLRLIKTVSYRIVSYRIG